MVGGVQHHTSIKARRVQERLVPEELSPVKHVRGGKLGGHVGHEFTVRKKPQQLEKKTEEHRGVRSRVSYLALLLNRVEFLLKTKLNSSL